MSLLSIGTVAVDSVRSPAGEVREVLGGSAVYFAVAASFFTPVRLVSVVGDDFGREHLERLEARGIDISGIEIRKGKTFRWSGEYSEDLSRRTTLSTELNVHAGFAPKVNRHDVGVKHLFLGNIDPELQSRFLTQIKPDFSACDTMNFWIDQKSETIKRLLTRVDGLLVNEAEVRQLAGEMHAIAAARRLIDLGLRFLVIKRGEHGAALFADGGYFNVPAYPVEIPIDPTGAGDSFAGGFMGHLVRKGAADPTSLREAMLYGSALASFCIEDFSLGRFDSVGEKGIEERYRALRGFMSLSGPRN